MRLHFTDQRARFPQHLEALRTVPVMRYDASALREHTSSIDCGPARSFTIWMPTFLFDYRIFPERILIALPQWSAEGRAMRVGDTIVQQVFLPPVAWPSQKLVFGVRIHGIVLEEARAGFSYETLEGHVERGISTFMLENSVGRCRFSVHTRSEPAQVLGRLVGPLFTRPYQAYCTRAALKHVREQMTM